MKYYFIIEDIICWTYYHKSIFVVRDSEYPKIISVETGKPIVLIWWLDTKIQSMLKRSWFVSTGGCDL